MEQNKIEQIKKEYPAGTTIQLNYMHGENNMPFGLSGEIICVDDIGQLHVSWENGSTLAVNLDVDRISVIPEIMLNRLEKKTPEKSGKEIHFIDNYYNDLFTIPDGGHILLTYANGERLIKPCYYESELFINIFDRSYHLCAFAEFMELAGTKFEPVKTPERSNENYKIVQYVLYKNSCGCALGYNPNAEQPYALWRFKQTENGKQEYDGGHYYTERKKAVSEYEARHFSYMKEMFVAELERFDGEIPTHKLAEKVKKAPAERGER